MLSRVISQQHSEGSADDGTVCVVSVMMVMMAVHQLYNISLCVSNIAYISYAPLIIMVTAAAIATTEEQSIDDRLDNLLLLLLSP